MFTAKRDLLFHVVGVDDMGFYLEGLALGVLKRTCDFLQCPLDGKRAGVLAVDVFVPDLVVAFVSLEVQLDGLALVHRDGFVGVVKLYSIAHVEVQEREVHFIGADGAFVVDVASLQRFLVGAAGRTFVFNEIVGQCRGLGAEAPQKEHQAKNGSSNHIPKMFVLCRANANIQKKLNKGGQLGKLS